MTNRSVLFITHAEVTIDPAIPVPCWRLSPKERCRHAAFGESHVANAITAIYCSGERKAIEGAEILGRCTRVRPRIVRELHENDRSSTGFLPPAAFQATADRFFSHPAESIRGWETAVDAQARIVAGVDQIISNDKTDGDIAIVAHGGVGALLLCHLAGVPISRTMDQPGSGGGNYFAFDVHTRSLIHGWRDIATPPNSP
jgi:broad specificity phosphatase PhoE